MLSLNSLFVLQYLHLKQKQQNYKISRGLRHQLSNGKNLNCCWIDIPKCSIGVDGGAGNSGS